MNRCRTAVALLAMALMLGGSACGDNGDDHGTPTAPANPLGEGDSGGDQGTPTAPATPVDDVELFEFEIVDGRASPPLDRAVVEQGARVRIVVTSDQPDEVHLHGYDRSAQVGPGEEGVIELVADQIGLFELETHETGLVLLQLQVQ